MKKADNQLLVIFGASGDLTSRKLLPSLFELYVRGLLPDRFCILGAARTAYGDEEFRAEQHTHILEAQKGKTYDEGLIDDFLENVYYLAFDSTNADEYYKLRERIEFLQEKHDLPDKIIYYLATWAAQSWCLRAASTPAHSRTPCAAPAAAPSKASGCWKKRGCGAL